jgi:hypothetical protein
VPANSRCHPPPVSTTATPAAKTHLQLVRVCVPENLGVPSLAARKHHLALRLLAQELFAQLQQTPVRRRWGGIKNNQ